MNQAQYNREDVAFASDSHFKHKNILKYTERGKLWDSIDDMNEGLISNWNEVVKPHMTTFLIGDFAFATKAQIRNFRSRLNGKIVLIMGNHDQDHHSDLPVDAFDEVHSYLEIVVDKRPIILFHYPIESWRDMHHGTWHLHGHCHGSLKPRDNLLRMDVGIDCHPNYRPFVMSEIEAYMQTKTFSPVDHHR